MATITNKTSGLEIVFGGATTYIKHGNVKLLKRGTNLNIYDDSDGDGGQRGQVYMSIPFSEVTSPVEANIDDLYNTVRGYIDVSAGGGAAWGGITGTLSDQTDLQTELDGKRDVGNINLASEVTGTLPVANGGTGVTTSTGTGNNVLSTSPTLVTPILGTPTSATLTNATGLPIINGTTGTLTVARGGNGRTSATAYAVVCGGTTSTGAHQSVASVGTSGQVLTSNGAGALPTFQTVSAGGTVYSNESSGITGSLNGNTNYTQSFTVTGAATGDRVTCGLNGDFYDDIKTSAQDINIIAKVTATNTVEVLFRIDSFMSENTNRKVWARIVK